MPTTGVAKVATLAVILSWTVWATGASSGAVQGVKSMTALVFMVRVACMKPFHWKAEDHRTPGVFHFRGTGIRVVCFGTGFSLKMALFGVKWRFAPILRLRYGILRSRYGALRSRYAA